jgi:hypothetical protein
MQTRSRSANERAVEVRSKQTTEGRSTEGRSTGGRSRRSTKGRSIEGPADGANEKAPAAIADLPDEILEKIVKLVVKGEPGSAALISLSDASTQMRGAVPRVISDALLVSLPQTVSTERLVRWMCKDSVLAADVLAKPRQREASVAILSRLVDLSELARSAKASEKVRALVRELIGTAHPALLESLRNATVGSQGTLMYPDPSALARDVIERLKGRGYDKIPLEPLALSNRIDEFISDKSGARARLIETHGPLCLWGVSGHTNLSFAFWVTPLEGIGFSSDLFWDTSSVTNMRSVFLNNAQFKGYIGTWDVGSVVSTDSMFHGAGIEDSGIGSWNTKRLSSARYMFQGAQGLSKDLDLSSWTFGPKPNLSSMFEGSGIVDCGIGNWDVSQANTRNMLKDANKFYWLHEPEATQVADRAIAIQ